MKFIIRLWQRCEAGIALLIIYDHVNIEAVHKTLKYLLGRITVENISKIVPMQKHMLKRIVCLACTLWIVILFGMYLLIKQHINRGSVGPLSYLSNYKCTDAFNVFKIGG